MNHFIRIWWQTNVWNKNSLISRNEKSWNSIFLQLLLTFLWSCQKSGPFKMYMALRTFQNNFMSPIFDNNSRHIITTWPQLPNPSVINHYLTTEMYKYCNSKTLFIIYFVKIDSKNSTVEEAELLRFEFIVDEVKSPGILSLLQDASEKLNTEWIKTHFQNSILF